MRKKKSKRDASADAAMPQKKNKNLKEEEDSSHQLVGNATNHSDEGNEGQLSSKMGKKKNKRDAPTDAAIPHKENKNLKKEEDSPHQLVGNATDHCDKGNEGHLYSKMGKTKSKRDASADDAMFQKKNKNLKKEEDSPQLVGNATNHTDKGNEGQFHSKMGKKKNKRDTPADVAISQKKNKKLKKEVDATNHSDKGTGEQQNVDNHSNENGSEVPIVKTKNLGVNPSKGYGNKGEQDVEDVPTVNEKANGGGAEYEGLGIRVYNMPPKVKKKDIVEAFKDCGTITRVILHGASRTNSGFAFVKFETEEAAKNALALGGIQLKDGLLRTELNSNISQKRYLRKNKKRGSVNKVDGRLSVFIDNLPWKVTEDEIRQFFNDSKIELIALAKFTGTSRLFGHVLFEDDESVENAMKKNNMELHGRSIEVYCSVIKNNEIRRRFGMQKKT